MMGEMKNTCQMWVKIWGFPAEELKLLPGGPIYFGLLNEEKHVTKSTLLALPLTHHGMPQACLH